ncbi:MAG: (deoxy)nucleoside triphosphate pyrophosphohydrolase [Clostridia bacterium]|nr:(deoxy)nucleoside triphosphate pyrophosphohydrolase [Clostridia bacterium]
MKKEVRVSAAMIFENGKVFATRRGESKYAYLAHKYEFPGGKVEAGESGEDCVKRELKEELNMDVKVGGLFAVERFEYPDFIVQLSLYECERLSEFTLTEHENYAWLRPCELEPFEWAPADAEILCSIKRVFGAEE